MPNDNTNPLQPILLRIEDVQRVLGLGRSSVYTLTKNDASFPKPIRLTKRAVAWRLADIEAWVELRASEDSP